MMKPLTLAAITLWKEAFTGIAKGASGTWFVQGKEGIFDAIDGLDATRASRQASSSSPSIAAHTNHILFALQVVNSEFLKSPQPKGGWEGSWKQNEFSEQEWDTLRQDVHDEYESFLHWLETDSAVEDPDEVTTVVAQIAHMGYHLGAIRQLLRLIQT